MNLETTSTASAPLVDVCIPTLGRSGFFREALESVLSQTLQSWRLVIAENGEGGSEVPAVLASYRDDARIARRVAGELLSQPANWTRAIQDGSAPFVAMMHDDDRWDPGFLARRIDFLERNPECVFVFSGFRMISSNGDVRDEVSHPLPEGVIARDEILPTLFKDCLVAPPTAVVRRKAYEAVGNRFRDILFNDHDMWIRLASQGDVGYLHVHDCEYRLHEGQTTRSVRTRVGEAQLDVINSTDDVPVPSDVRQEARARAHVLAAIDSAESGERRRALRHLQGAVRARPSALFSFHILVRIAAVLVALPFGERGARAFGAWRFRRFQQRMGG